MSFFPFSYYLVPLRHNYPPQHPIIKHPLPTYLLQWKWPSFTPIQRQAKLEFCIS
jgi:hypothetical protein